MKKKQIRNTYIPLVEELIIELKDISITENTEKHLRLVRLLEMLRKFNINYMKGINKKLLPELSKLITGYNVMNNEMKSFSKI